MALFCADSTHFEAHRRAFSPTRTYPRCAAWRLARSESQQFVTKTPQYGAKLLDFGLLLGALGQHGKWSPTDRSLTGTSVHSVIWSWKGTLRRGLSGKGGLVRVPEPALAAGCRACSLRSLCGVAWRAPIFDSTTCSRMLQVPSLGCQAGCDVMCSTLLPYRVRVKDLPAA